MLPIVEHQVQDEQPQTTQQPHPTASASAPSPLPPNRGLPRCEKPFGISEEALCLFYGIKFSKSEVLKL